MQSANPSAFDKPNGGLTSEQEIEKEVAFSRFIRGWNKYAAADAGQPTRFELWSAAWDAGRNSTPKEPAPRKAARKLSPLQELVMLYVPEIRQTWGFISFARLIEDLVIRLPPPAPGDPDRRRTTAIRAVSSLEEKGLLKVLDGRVSELQKGTQP